MPPVPAVRGSQLVNALQKAEFVAGFVVGRIDGSHHIMRHLDGRRTTVPVHAGRDIRPGTWTATGCVALLALIAGTVFYLHMLVAGKPRRKPRRPGLQRPRALDIFLTINLVGR
jgi:predicted RNA binding protein YcfA (HicA-like mRNA interferase family)